MANWRVEQAHIDMTLAVLRDAYAQHATRIAEEQVGWSKVALEPLTPQLERCIQTVDDLIGEHEALTVLLREARDA